MHNFTRNLITEWRRLKLPFAGETFVVAVSGGADSVGLLLALHELRERRKLENRLVIAHFNHNLRGADGERDADFVRGLTTRLNFEFVCKMQNPESKLQNQTGNLEQNARAARYEFLAETAAILRAEYVLTAHTLNDQAETFLINLIRGSGLEGLGGMKAAGDFGFQVSGFRVEDDSEPTAEFKIQDSNFKIRLIRPLLNWAKREDAENFCLTNNIEFRHDAMNDDLKFSRVRIRKILLPLLKEFNPKIIETLARTAGIMRESAGQLSVVSYQLSENREPGAGSRKPTLLLKDLRDVFPSVLRVTLREWLKDNRGNLRGLTLKHIEAIEKLIFSRRSGKVIELPKGETVTKNGGKLHFQNAKVEKSQMANYNQTLGCKALQADSENNG